MILEFLTATSVAASAIEVWTAGDDGLTQRFAENFRTATREIHGRPLNATVAQITPAPGGGWLTVVTFSREGEKLYTAKCARDEAEIQQCVLEAASAAKRLTQ
ncbi:hypothetical protein [Caulobacter segnis]|uniref:Uncharacterized protein n=1 Tax=Caulobacter segnis TaxID=88688 RepID=A0A2W5V8T8_9CAUL|nr:hypothetical protein [Caulobacter segnis]PZR33106.1 MAG: hypothetical protein DI526_14500 [Caulobacter segnis]